MVCTYVFLNATSVPTLVECTFMTLMRVSFEYFSWCMGESAMPCTTRTAGRKNKGIFSTLDPTCNNRFTKKSSSDVWRSPAERRNISQPDRAPEHRSRDFFSFPKKTSYSLPSLVWEVIWCFTFEKKDFSYVFHGVTCSSCSCRVFLAILRALYRVFRRGKRSPSRPWHSLRRFRILYPAKWVLQPLPAKWKV